MPFTIERPKFSGSLGEQVGQLKSWLFRLVDELEHQANHVGFENLTEDAVKMLGNRIFKDQKAEMSSQFDALKSIIVKTGNIAQAHYEEINKNLNANYVTVSEFGTYKEDATQRIKANAEGITQNFERIEEVSTSLTTVETDFRSYRKETSAYIKTGWLYDELIDGVSVPRYGLAVGENIVQYDDQGNEIYRSENKLATFTPQKQSFWQNNVEIGYFSGNMLYCSGGIRIGDWTITNTYGLTIRKAQEA